jgi:phosphoglycerate dehydrogenase-like enzyme
VSKILIRLGITVVNAPGSNAQSVAEPALALALAALRKVPWSSAALGAAALEVS